MLPEYLYPERHWPDLHWPIPDDFIQFFRSDIRTRRFLKQKWFVTLIDSVGSRTELGYIDIESDGSDSVLTIPGTVANGTYQVEIKTTGLAWKSLIQKDFQTIIIDDTSSEPIVDTYPLITDFQYDIYQNWLRLLWNVDVEESLIFGSVSAGLWFTLGVPDFGTDPDVIIPLFSYNTEHQYLIQAAKTQLEMYQDMFWLDTHYITNYWIKNHWLNVGAFNYAGIAIIDADDNIGPGQYITLPDRSVITPIATIEEN